MTDSGSETPGVGVLIAPGLEEIEALAPVDLLRRAGIGVELVALTEELAVRGSHDIIVTCERRLSETDLNAYELLFLPGGQPGTRNLLDDERVRSHLRERVDRGGEVAAICAAPSILADLGLLEGKAATSHPSVEKVLVERGARFRAEAIVRDGSIVTSRGMGTSIALGLHLVARMTSVAEAEALADAIIYG